MKTVLVPLDGSALAEVILPWAKFIAKKDESRLELMFCYTSSASTFSFPDFASLPPIPTDLDGFARTAQKYMQRLIQDFELDESTITIREGDPASEILARSEADDVTEILLSSHGVGGLGRWLLGSVATKIVRGSRKPVFLLKQPQREDAQIGLEKILVAIDGSDSSERTFESAVGLARRFGAALHLFRAAYYPPHPYSDIRAALDEEVSASKTQLNGFAAKHPDLEITTSARVRNPSEGILEEAKSCDLVVVASHGDGGFERWLLGSVTEKVVNKSKIPVYIVQGL